MPQPAIRTRDLTSAQVPVITPSLLDYSRDARDQLTQLWNFALTFDGYRYFGVETAPGRLGPFAESVAEEYNATGELPRLGEIGMYRACLFYEQRAWCKWSKAELTPTREDVTYWAELCGWLRHRLA